MSLPQIPRKLKKGVNSTSVPDYLLVGITAEDDFSLCQRHLNFVTRKNFELSNLPPPTKFSSASKASRKSPVRSFSAGDMETDNFDAAKSFGMGADQDTAQVSALPRWTAALLPHHTAIRRIAACYVFSYKICDAIAL